MRSSPTPRCSIFEDDTVRIRHILDAAREAVDFAKGRSREDLSTDRQLNLSTVRLLEIIGQGAPGIQLEYGIAFAEAVLMSSPPSRSQIFDNVAYHRLDESGFGGWADEKIERSREAVPLFGREEIQSTTFDDISKANPDLPSKSMIGMRDRLIHAYFDVNLDVVWQTVTEDLPALIAKLENTLPD